MSAITPLMEDYPKRKFVFFGDSGQEEPEIYGHIARSFPDQILEIYIRNITPEIDKDCYNIGHAF
jgi:phosphatidate phosphatase APP1